MMTRWILLGLTLLAAPTLAADFYMDRAATDSGSCGAAIGTPCKTWAQFKTNGNIPGPGETVHFAAGTYPERITIDFDGNASSPVTVQCDGSPESCIIDGTGTTYTNMTGCGFFCVGCTTPSLTACNNVNAASFVKIVGFKITGVPTTGTNRWRESLDATAGSNHIVFRQMAVDGTGATDGQGEAQVVFEGGSYISYIGGKSINCKATNGNGGCLLSTNRSQKLAIIGNTLGPHNTWPVSSSNNTDCMLLVNVDTALVDGNTATKCGDGLDTGQISSLISQPLANIIERYNDVAGCKPTSGPVNRCFKISGDADTGTTSTKVVIYKNVVHPTDATVGGNTVQVDELSQFSDLWYNTLFNNVAGEHAALWLVGLATGTVRAQIHDIGVEYNIFSSDASTVDRPVRMEQETTNPPINMCAASSCPFVGNQWDYPNAGAGNCVEYDPSDVSGVTPACSTAGIGTAGTCESGTLNTTYTQNTCNYFGGASFVARGTPTVFSNLALTSGSSGRDKGNSFCHATASATNATTISVSCDGKAGTDPRLYFPDPANAYGVLNADCASKGVRAADANGANNGCFDLMIEGCGGTGGLGSITGVRTVTSMTASSISWTGQTACSWANGAKVHVMWEGAAPDLGAFEYNSGAATTSTTTTATTSTSTVTGSTTTTLAVFTTYG